MSLLRVILTTLPSAEQARDLTKQLLTERLIACGNVIPGVQSIYEWAGKLCDEPEVLCLLKTQAERVEAAMLRIAELHPYDVPEIVVLAPEQVSDAYAAWVKQSTDLT